MGWRKVKELKKKLFQGKPFIQKSHFGCQPFIQSTFTGCLLGVNHCAEDTEVKNTFSAIQLCQMLERKASERMPHGTINKEREAEGATGVCKISP